MLGWMPNKVSGLRTASLLYWQPWSEWKISPRGGSRRTKAFWRAVTTNAASKLSLSFQPTTKRLKKSRITAR
jgi:hypothetical protein